MVNPSEYLKQSRRRKLEREHLIAHARRMFDALLKVEVSITKPGTRSSPRALARDRARIKFFLKELDTCRKQLRKLGG